MLVRGKHVLKEETKKYGCVSRNYPEPHEVSKRRTSHTSGIMLHFLSTRPEKSSGLQLVEWEADTCMLQQISLLRWQCVTSNVKQEHLIQNCLRKLTRDL